MNRLFAASFAERCICWQVRSTTGTDRGFLLLRCAVYNTSNNGKVRSGRACHWNLAIRPNRLSSGPVSRHGSSSCCCRCLTGAPHISSSLFGVVYCPVRLQGGYCFITPCAPGANVPSFHLVLPAVHTDALAQGSGVLTPLNRGFERDCLRTFQAYLPILDIPVVVAAPSGVCPR